METEYGNVRYEWAVEADAKLTDAPTILDKQELEPWSRPGTMKPHRIRLRWYAHEVGKVPSLSLRVFGQNVRKDGSLGAPVNIGVNDLNRAPQWLQEAFVALRDRTQLQMDPHGVNLGEQR